MENPTPRSTDSGGRATSTRVATPATATATATREEAPTATTTPRPSPSPRPRQPLPAEWTFLGSEYFGLQLPAPKSWVDGSNGIRGSESGDRYNKRIILVANEQETITGLNSGTLPEGSAFAAAFVLENGLDENPEETLAMIVAEAGDDDAVLEEVEGITVDGVPGASVHVNSDIFALFTPSEEVRHYRVLLFEDPGSAGATVYVFGTLVDEWERLSRVFETMVRTMDPRSGNIELVGNIVSGNLMPGVLARQETNLWLFRGEHGRYATINLTPSASAIDLTLTLLDPAGNVLVSMDSGFAGDPESLTDVPLPSDGLYVIEVSEFFSEAGQYRLGLLLSDEPQFEEGGRLNYGEEITSELPEDSSHTWIFDGTAGQTISIVLKSLDEQLDLIMHMRGPEGRELMVLDEGFAGDAEVLAGFELPVTGEYILEINGFAGHGGAYSLSLDEGGESTVNFFDAGDIVYGETKQGVLSENEAHAWFFDGRKGEAIAIEVTPSQTNMDLDVWLIGPNLEELVLKDEFLSGEAERIAFVLEADGEYLILVREYFGEPGGYEIQLDVEADNLIEVAGSITYGETLTGTLTRGRRAGWLFDGLGGDSVTITVAPANPDRDIVLALVEPGGRTVLRRDEALAGLAESILEFELTTDGEWLIVIQEYFYESTDYTVTVSKGE